MAGPLANASEPAPSSAAWSLGGRSISGTRRAWTQPAVAHASVAGVAAPLHDGQWFDRIHVIPRTVDLGYLSGDRNVDVEVWNAWRRGRSLTTIPVTGPEGVSAPSVTLPQDFAALQSRMHTVLISIHGGTQVGNVVTWVFAGIVSEGADLTLTGWRLIAFSIPPDGNSPIQETLSYLTDILESWDGHEQRFQLREVPLYGLEYAFTCLQVRDSQLLHSLLEGQGASPFAVPLWQYAERLGVGVAIGATSLTVPTASILYPDWMETNLVLLWQDPHVWEVLPVETVGSGTVSMTEGTRRAWPVGSLVIPVMIGSLAGAPDVARDTTRVRSGKVAFRMLGA